MTRPPRDRWIVVWVGASAYWWPVDTPILVKWQDEAGFGMRGAFSAEARDPDSDEMLWFDADDIAAWAECPARPAEP